MKKPVVYVVSAPGPIAARLRGLIGDDFVAAPLPYAAQTIEDRHQEKLELQLKELLDVCSPGSRAVFHDLHVVPPKEKQALECAVKDDAVVDLMRGFAVSIAALDTRATRLEYCWAVSVMVRGRSGMPSGLVVLVDHATLETFPRRLADLGHLFFTWEEPPGEEN